MNLAVDLQNFLSTRGCVYFLINMGQWITFVRDFENNSACYYV